VEKPLKAAATALRQENAALKKRINALEKIVTKCQSSSASEKQIKELPSDADFKNVKIQPHSITAMRKKHGLSMLKMAALLDFDHKSIGRWEQGKGAPQASSKKKLLAFKNMTKSEVKKMIKELDAKTTAAPAKKAVAKKAVAKKAVAKKAVAKKASVKTAVAKKTVAKKAPAKKKAVAKKAVTKKAVAKKAVAKKAVAKKAVAKKAVAKKAPVKKAIAKKTVAKKAPAKKNVAKRKTAKK